MLVYNAKRQFTTPESFISNLLTKEHISIIKVGKNLTEPILDSYNIIDIEDLANDDFLIFLDDFLYPNQHIKR